MSENERGATVGASDPKADAKRQAALQRALTQIERQDPLEGEIGRAHV